MSLEGRRGDGAPLAAQTLVTFMPAKIGEHTEQEANA
jgi:hypothetical protein